MQLAEKSRVKFSEALKAWRKKTEKTQSDAAEFLGVNLDTYQNWEQERQHPKSYVQDAIRARIS